MEVHWEQVWLVLQLQRQVCCPLLTSYMLLHQQSSGHSRHLVSMRKSAARSACPGSSNSLPTCSMPSQITVKLESPGLHPHHLPHDFVERLRAAVLAVTQGWVAPARDGSYGSYLNDDGVAHACAEMWLVRHGLRAGAAFHWF